MLEDVESFISEINSRTQVLELEKNVDRFGLKYFGMADERQVRLIKDVLAHEFGHARQMLTQGASPSRHRA